MGRRLQKMEVPALLRIPIPRTSSLIKAGYAPGDGARHKWLGLLGQKKHKIMILVYSRQYSDVLPPGPAVPS